ncbi:hypothetical protein [Spiroplasma endosymbiont of Polydrusus pterygomalis]|uniref:hypothetical protein n=1 Tax=Spiroplasma endosymbiont of Polydrusus pterygomalis TaxID=3139327 RepID=UPI003CCA9D21
MNSSPLISRSSSEQILTNSTDNKSKIVSYLSDGLFVAGNSMVTTGNYLLNKVGLLPLAPALCFIIDGGINSKIALTNLILRYQNKNNKIVNAVSAVVSSLATTISLSTAIPLINWSPEVMPVRDAFITAAAASGLNTIIVTSQMIKDCCLSDNDEENTANQQPTLCQKIVNIATSSLPLVTIASTITGVSFFAYNKLSNPNNDDDKSFFDKESTAFYLTIGGLAVDAFGLSIKTVNEWKNWCVNTTTDELDLENGAANYNYIIISASSSTSSLTSSEEDINGDEQYLASTSATDNHPDSKPFNDEEIEDVNHEEECWHNQQLFRAPISLRHSF